MFWQPIALDFMRFRDPRDRCDVLEIEDATDRARMTCREDVMRLMLTWSHAAVVLAAAGLFTPMQAQDASNFPTRPIRVIVPVGAGAGVDNAARITAEAVEKHLGQRLVVENRPGAGARLGATAAAKAPADGYTLLFTSPTPIVVTEHFPPKMDYDPGRDFRPVAMGVVQPALLIVRSTLGVKSVDELIDYARRNPGRISFGVQGLGSEMHLSLELFKKTASVNITAIPYNSAAQAIVDLLANRLDAMFLVIPPIKQHVESGKLVALATLNSRRVEAFPNVPTMAEIGRGEMTNAIWFGYLAPAQTPDAIIGKLARAFAQLQSDAVLGKRVGELGADLDILGPAEFGAIIESDRRRYGKIVTEGNLTK
jgi:tripartite-type tricarboxylate transporter receptor subunit TctC